MPYSAILLIDCPDRPGLVAAISQFFRVHGPSNLHADQHQDSDAGLHRLIDLLHRHQIGELPSRIAMIVSNHRDAEELAAFYRVRFHYFDVNPASKAEVQQRQLALLENDNVELVILARYIQILYPAFVARYPRRIINVHHSFLPAFSGAPPLSRRLRARRQISRCDQPVRDRHPRRRPHHQADVDRVSHSDQVCDLIQKGRELERVVLSRAVHWHLYHRILSYANKTVIFD